MANTNSQKRDSISEKDNNEHPTVTSSSIEPTESNSRTHVPNSSSDPLQQILEKLSKLESIDNRLTEIQTSFDTPFTDLQSSFVAWFTEVKTTLNTRLNEVFTRMTNLEEKLAPLEDLPLLTTRLSAVEKAITQIQSEQTNCLYATNSAAVPDVFTVRRLEKLENDYRQLNAAQQILSNELVITGLPTTDTTSHTGAVYAVLKLLDDELLESDIRHVRKIRQKPSSEPLNYTAPITADELQNVNAGGSPTMASQISSQSTRVDTRPWIAPLIVTLSSHSLAMSLVNAKMKMGKLHSSQHSVDLLKQARVTIPLQPSFININEFLLPDLHRLRLQARTEAKKKGFITYVRSGRLYIKKKREEQATIITSTEELNNFLGYSSHHHYSFNHVHLIPTHPPSSSTSRSSGTLNRGLRVCHFNANSIRGHMGMINHYLSTHTFFHVIAVTETCLDPESDYSNIVYLNDCVLFRCDRNKNGGDVALFIHNSISATILCSSDGAWTGKPGKPEYIFCEVTVKGHPPFLVAVVYRPPHAPFLKDTDFIDKITTYMHDYSTKIILGDFNADQLSLSDDAVFVRKFIAENGLQNVPFGATHYKPTSDTWHDLCLVDEQDRILDFYKTESRFINGHDLITATLALQTPKPTITSFTYRDYSAISAESLNDFLRGLDWSVAESAPLDECISVLQSHVTSAIN